MYFVTRRHSDIEAIYKWSSPELLEIDPRVLERELNTRLSDLEDLLSVEFLGVIRRMAVEELLRECYHIRRVISWRN